jgi:SEC-C motif
MAMKSIWPPTAKCPCGSGKQYGACHYQKVYKNHVELEHDLPKFMHSAFSCLAPVSDGFCGASTIKSHSIPKSACLSTISESGHVYSFPSGPNTKPHPNKNSEFHKISINKASTFPGFCAVHDGPLFSQIDRDEQGTDFKSCLLRSYRASTYEAAIHTRGALFSTYIGQDARFAFTFHPEYASEEAALMRKWARHGWERKTIYERRLKREISRKYWFAAGHTSTILPFASTGSFAIEVDFDGNRLQDNHTDQEFSYCELWIIPTKNGTTFGIGALEVQNPRALRQFIQSFAKIDKKHLASKLLQLSIAHLENTYFNISFIDQLSHQEQVEILEFFSECLVSEVGDRIPSDALTRKPVVSVPAHVDKFFSNV